MQHAAVIYLASTSHHKTRELARLLAQPISPIAGYEAPAEDADTFAGNARLKAVAGLAQAPADAVVIADDSGLEVDALAGRPGVRSARFGGDGLDDAGRTDALLAELRGVENRAAAYICVLALARPGEPIALFDGRLEGSISSQPRGDGGFGYDPVFIPSGSSHTVAELPAQAKDAISHRARAAQRLRHAAAGDDPRPRR